MLSTPIVIIVPLFQTVTEIYGGILLRYTLHMHHASMKWFLLYPMVKLVINFSFLQLRVNMSRAILKVGLFERSPLNVDVRLISAFGKVLISRPALRSCCSVLDG